jgi:hypothetical protein
MPMIHRAGFDGDAAEIGGNFSPAEAGHAANHHWMVGSFAFYVNVLRD